MRNPQQRLRCTIRWVICGIVAAGGLLAGTACRDVLKVQDPTNFAGSTLDNPALWPSLANGAEGDLQLALSSFVIQTGMLSDELWDSSTWIDWHDVSQGAIRANWATAGSFSGVMDAITRARYSAQSAMARFSADMKDTANTNALMIQVSTVDAWADLLLAMGFCQAPSSQGGSAASDTAMFQQAITKLTAVLALAKNGHYAKAADQQAAINWVVAGLARANLMVGNYDAAAAWAGQIPAGFSKLAVYSANTTAQNNQLFFQGNAASNRSYTVRGVWYNQIDTVGGALRDWYSNQDDPRVPLTHDNNNSRGYNLGAGGVVKFFSNGKAATAAAPIVMAGYPEMVLIQAEVAWRKGNLAQAVSFMNINRAAAGLPALVLPGSGDQNAWTKNALLNERFAQLFTEGHRLNDVYRFGLIKQLLGANRATKLPMSTTEATNNQKIGLGKETCPAIS